MVLSEWRGGNKKQKIMENQICEKCNKEVSETYMCERCEMMYCDDCGAVYDQFSQIDYNCCKRCAETNHD